MSTGKFLRDHLRFWLPQFTDYFTDDVALSSMTRVGSTVTVTTSGSHGLNSGDYVTIAKTKVIRDIVSITRVGDRATVVTATDHDLTVGFIAKVQIDGAIEPEFNGRFNLIDVPNRQTFIIQVADSGPLVATGTPVLLEDHNLGFNGRFQITVTGPTTFEVTNDSPALSDFAYVIDSYVRINARIVVDATYEHARNAYTEKNVDKILGAIVLDDGIISRDRNMLNDAANLRTQGDNYQVRMITNFSFYIFIPTRSTVRGYKSVSGGAARDLAEDLRKPIYKSLLRLLMPSPFVLCPYSVLTPLDHGLFEYNTAFYAHRFRFEFAEEIVSDTVSGDPLGTGGDTLPIIDTVAFRDMILRYRTLNEEIGKEDYIDLDEDPIP